MPDRKRKPEQTATSLPSKLCSTCGRTMTWRKSWARNWEDVKFCSDACRSRGVKETDRRLEGEILRLLRERGAGKTICPSEAARAVAGSDARAEWEPLMEPARAAARRLVGAQAIVVTQHGQIVDASTAKGPIRLRLR